MGCKNRRRVRCHRDGLSAQSGIINVERRCGSQRHVAAHPPRTVDFGSAVLYAQTMSALKRDPRFSQPLDFFRVLLTLHSGSGEAKNTEAALRMLLKEYVLEHIMPVSVEIERAAADLGTVYETEQPKGSYEAYQRALTHLNALNGEIISLFREVWSRQVEAVETADASLISTAACGVSHE